VSIPTLKSITIRSQSSTAKTLSLRERSLKSWWSWRARWSCRRSRHRQWRLSIRLRRVRRTT